jgi:hypothetical protein
MIFVDCDVHSRCEDQDNDCSTTEDRFAKCESLAGSADEQSISGDLGSHPGRTWLAAAPLASSGTGMAPDLGEESTSLAGDGARSWSEVNPVERERTSLSMVSVPATAALDVPARSGLVP